MLAGCNFCDPPAGNTGAHAARTVDLPGSCCSPASPHSSAHALLRSPIRRPFRRRSHWICCGQSTVVYDRPRSGTGLSQAVSRQRAPASFRPDAPNWSRGARLAPRLSDRSWRRHQLCGSLSQHVTVAMPLLNEELSRRALSGRDSRATLANRILLVRLRVNSGAPDGHTLWQEGQ